MDKKITRFNIVHGDDEYEIPEECEAAEEAAEELAKTNLEEHYSFINLLSIAVIMLFACIFFISVSGSDIVEDNNLSLTFKTFFSGDYTQALEDSYNNSIPFPDAMKAVEERISLIYGIGNKVTDPIKETPDNTDSNHNSFDHPTNNDSDDPDENVITTTAKPQDGEVTTTKKKEDKKKTTTTTAIDRPEETKSTTTTSTASTSIILIFFPPAFPFLLSNFIQKMPFPFFLGYYFCMPPRTPANNPISYKCPYKKDRKTDARNKSFICFLCPFTSWF